MEVDYTFQVENFYYCELSSVKRGKHLATKMCTFIYTYTLEEVKKARYYSQQHIHVHVQCLAKTAAFVYIIP